MTNRLASKQKKFLWLPLLLGSVGCLLAIGACSVDKSKYTFIPDDQFNSTADAGNGNGGGANPNGGEGNPGGGDSGAGNADAGTGNTVEPTTCTTGQHNCTDDGHLQSCKGGMFDDGVDCGEAGRCNAAQGVCLKCAPGEFQCSNTTLQQCNIFGTAFEDSKTCDSKADCVASGQKGFCVVCKPATASCEATDVKPTNADSGPVILTDRLLACNTDGSGTDTTQVCEEESQVCNATSKICETCTPGGYVCDGNQLSVCDPDGMNYTFKKQCVSGLLCDPVNGVCNDGPDKCNIGDFNCVGDTLEACDNTGTFVHIDSCGPGLCDKNAGRCQTCLYSQSTCVNNNVQSCDGSNNASTLYISQSCIPGSCTVSGTYAYCGACTPGTILCYPNSQSYNYCGGASGTCQTGQVCNLAAVTDPTAPPCVTCIPNRFSCDQNGVLSQCSADGSVNNVIQNCRTPGTSSQCSAAAGKCIPANVGQYTCNDNGDLAQVIYDSNHQVTTETVTKDANKCGSPNLCQPYSGSCNRPRCTVGQTTCQNGAVMSCDNGQQRQRTGTQCATTTRCQDGIGCVKTLAIAAGDAHTCAIVGGPDAVDGDPGMVLCWGANESGQLGDGSPLLSDSKEARQVVVTMTDNGGGASSTSQLVTGPYFSGICAGKNFTCVDINFNQPGVACWGSNESGQLGLNTADPGPYNSPFNGVQDSSGTQPNGAVLTNVTCGAEFACALGPDGAAWCWGANDSGQQGTGSVGTPSLAAAPVAGHQFTQLVAGARHVCGIQADNTVWCWGDNSSGQLGTGDTKNSNSPTPVMVGTIAAASDRPPALGNDFSLALSTDKSSKSPYSWGANLFGQLGNGSNGDTATPGSLSGLTTAALGDTGTLYTGSTAEHACARVGDTLQCWGANVFGELGDETTNDNSSPVLVFDGKTNATKLAPGAHSVAVGGRHTCAINASGDVLCWGANHRYQLGSAVLTPQRIPARAY